jgi:hypothetical protein
MAANGKTFSQHVRARNISSSGALFSGLEHELKVGDVIGVQYGDRKSRCKVIWVMDGGPTQKMESRSLPIRIAPGKLSSRLTRSRHPRNPTTGAAMRATGFPFPWNCAMSA